MKKVFVYGDRGLLRNYAEALEACGAAAVFSKNLEYSKDCGAVLLPGGGDIDPKLYGQEREASFQIDRERDEKELELIRDFSVTRRPILGICKGIQILNVAFGGTLIQDVENAQAHKWEERTGDKVHLVEARGGSFLFPLYGCSFTVNSAHHQAIGTVAPGLSVSATAEDGVVEALECRKKNVYAVQWHPERMAFRHTRPDTVDGRCIFEFFLDQVH